ncbi:MAG TPA: VOC family protein [Verrucomicrobiae bacterium]|nr:VOC family protein [Verrucomicrobiae bacterium]
MTLPPAPRCGFDHVSLGVKSIAAELPEFAGRLGGRILPGGVEASFRGLQLRYAGGGTVELLEPLAGEAHGFLQRFLDRRGPGPHHLTFTVDDLSVALERARALGWHPVAVDRGHPLWQEAFLHPREALGTTIQLAQAGWPGMEWAAAVAPPLRFTLPGPAPAAPARLERVDHLVPTLQQGLRLYRDLLGGVVVGSSGADSERGSQTPVVDVVFAGGRVHLVASGTADSSPTAGIRGLHFTLPAAAAGARERGDARQLITAAGTPLHLAHA